MFEYLYGWMENLAGYLILVTAIMQLLPENSYQKYIRFFTGLVLVVMLAAPVLEMFGMQGEFKAACEQAVRTEERRMEQKIDKYMKDFNLEEESVDGSQVDEGP